MSGITLSALIPSLVIFLPAVAALVLCFMPRRQEDSIKQLSLVTTGIVFLLTVWMALPSGWLHNSPGFDLGNADVQHVVSASWIPAFHIHYLVGIDGISFPLVILTSFLSMLAMAASWNIAKHVKGYCILFLLLETGMLGVFMALDFFLFYVFWEVMLLPMYFLIGIWGGPRREYAAIKFFLFTLVGSVLMLIAHFDALLCQRPEPAGAGQARRLSRGGIDRGRRGQSHFRRDHAKRGAQIGTVPGPGGPYL